MLVWREKLVNIPIMSLQTGAQLATATEPVLDPKDLAIVAFYCEGPLIDFRPAILHTSDIREFGELGLIVNDSDDIMPLDDDLVRTQEVISYHFDLLDKKVFDTSKHKLGKVGDYVIDSVAYKIMKFSVRRPVFKSLQQGELIIGRRQIRKVADDYIVVAAPTAEEEMAVLRPSQVQNPFRQQAPEHPRAAEHSQTR